MSTRAQVRFATREEGVTFSEMTDKFHAQFYKHHDGYPEGLGVDLATTLLDSGSWNGVPLEIDSLDTRRGDTEYMYYIWQAPLKTTWISVFQLNRWSDKEVECIFVGEPQKLLDKYKQNTNYDR
jgi:hypothetical protein|tara:strand:- start:520 stop:891 length:372 start_codon:yes stop_codon:yes gene_type:complete